MVSEAEHGRVPMLIGFTFERHGDFDRALRPAPARRGQGQRPLRRATPTRRSSGSGQSLLAEQRYAEASLAFARLATLAKNAADRAHALYQEARAHELRGRLAGGRQDLPAGLCRRAAGGSPGPRPRCSPPCAWSGAPAPRPPPWRSTRSSPRTPNGAAKRRGRPSSSPPRISSAGGTTAPAPGWRRPGSAAPGDRLEADYWSGRLAELEKNGREAVRPLSGRPAGRSPPPARPRGPGAARRRAARPRRRGRGAPARRRRPSSTTSTAPGCCSAAIRPARWPSAGSRRRCSPTAGPRPTCGWPRCRCGAGRCGSKPLARPEEMLLALGVWHEGAPAMRAHFPLSDPVARLHRRPAARPGGRPRALDRDGRGAARPHTLAGPAGAPAR